MKKWICLALVIISLFLLAVPTYAADAPTYKVDNPRWVTIDGKVSESEWGKPIYSGVSLKDAEAGNVDNRVSAIWFDSTNNQDTTFDLYVSNNDTNILVACVIHNVDPEISKITDMKKRMYFAFTFSKWDSKNDVYITMHKKEPYEQYCGYRIGVDAAGNFSGKALTQGHDPIELYRGHEYIAKYDVATRTMTYEAMVPYSNSNVDIQKDNVIAFSATINLNYDGNSVSNTSNGPNKFLVGKGTFMCGGKANYAHKDQCIKIELASHAQIEKYTSKEETTTTTTTNNKTTIDESPEIVTIPERIANTVKESSPLVVTVTLASAVIALASIVMILILAFTKRKKEGKHQ